MARRRTREEREASAAQAYMNDVKRAEEEARNATGHTTL